MATLKLSTLQQLIQNSGIAQNEKDSLLMAARQAATIPDTWIYRIVVSALGLAIFIPLAAVLANDSAGAQMLLPIATGSLGALAGLLAPSPASGG